MLSRSVFCGAISLLWAVAAVACGDSAEVGAGGAGGSSSSSGGAASGGGEAAGGSAAGAGGQGGSGGDVDEAAGCVAEFGDALTDDYARLDGTVVAVVKPSDTQCPTFNDDHIVLEVAMEGAVYRLVANVGAPGDPPIRFAEIDHAMPAPAFSEGWHTGVQLDYVITFDVHSDADFEAIEMGPLADRIADDITIGEHISVYATSSGGASAHLIHRNSGFKDGAIFLHPDSGLARVMLFHFDNQTF